MPISVEERYKQAFESHRHASDFRATIIKGWGVLYGAIAAAFVWAQANQSSLLWVVPLAGVVFTILMWLADHRNRDALLSARKVGSAVEEEAGIPAGQRFFTGLEVKEGFTHSDAIDVFAGVTLLVFAGSTVALLLGWWTP